MFSALAKVKMTLFLPKYLRVTFPSPDNNKMDIISKYI